MWKKLNICIHNYLTCGLQESDFIIKQTDPRSLIVVNTSACKFLLKLLFISSSHSGPSHEGSWVQKFFLFWLPYPYFEQGEKFTCFYIKIYKEIQLLDQNVLEILKMSQKFSSPETLVWALQSIWNYIADQQLKCIVWLPLSLSSK